MSGAVVARVPTHAFVDTRVCLLKEPLLDLQPLVDLERGVAILRCNQKCGSLLKHRRSVGGAVCAQVGLEIPAIRRCARRNQKCGSLLMRRRSVGGAVYAWVGLEIPAIRRCTRRRRHCAGRHVGSHAGGGVTVASTSRTHGATEAQSRTSANLSQRSQRKSLVQYQLECWLTLR